MSILSELNSLLLKLEIAVETGKFSGAVPNEYVVITPLSDTFEVHADNRPRFEVQEVRLSLFCKSNYQIRKNQIVKELLSADFTVTDRRYIGHEDDSGYYHYAVDIAKEYEFEGE